MKILIVEDEEKTTDFLARGLAEEGFAVDTARDAPTAEDCVAINEYDLIVLDVMLPGGNGFSLCRRWREAGLTTPILFLTARDEVRDRVRGLELGADDYLVKPFSFEELLARIRANIRRSTGLLVSEIEVNGLRIDPARRMVRLEGRLVPLTAREYQLLEYLAVNRGAVVSRTRLWEHVWESGGEPESNVVDVYIRYLRNKLGASKIETVRGAGYRLVDPGDQETENESR